MTAGRLAVAVLLCAGLDVTGAGAHDVPISVAVPPSARPPAPADGKTAGKSGAPDQTQQADAASEKEEDASGKESLPAPAADGSSDSEKRLEEEEEYFPVDLPPAEEDTGTETETEQEEVPGVEQAVLGLEPEEPETTYFVHAEILGLPNGEGVVAASLCKRKNFTKSGCRTERVAAREDRVSITFENVAPGTYAVQVHHDQNNNGKMDFSFFGLPKEPYGFSRDAKPMLAPPKFDSASFEVKGRDVSLVINLQNI